MPTKSKPVNVAFYTMEPTPAFDEAITFKSGYFPWTALHDAMKRLDAAADDYRIRDHLWGGETLCLLHDDGPRPIVGAYYKDTFSKLLTEYKGQVTEATLREGEGPVASAYMAGFPNDVVGLVRTSSQAPGFATISRWISSIASIAGGLTSLPDADTTAQLKAAPRSLHRLQFGCYRRALRNLETSSPSVANVLQAALGVNAETDRADVDLRAVRGRTAEFAAKLLDDLQELMAALPDLEMAKVHVSGRKNPINLKRSQVVAHIPVMLQDTKKLGLHEAAEALFLAYTQERVSIEAAVKALPYRA